MKITIERSELVRMLSSVERVVENRNTIPILSSVLLQATDGEFSVRATDLDIQVEVTKPLICEAGSVCVPAKTLSMLAKKAGAKEVTMELVDDHLIVKSGRSRVKLNTLQSKDFPAFPSGKYDAEFSADLSKMFDATKFAISNEEARYYLNGVYLVGTDEKLEAVATTGHILSKVFVDSVGAFDGVIVPRKIVGITPEGVVKVSVSSKLIRIENEDTVIVSKLVDGTYPPYERIIPTGNRFCAKFDKVDMSSAVNFVSSILSDKGRAIVLDVAPGAINLSAHSSGSDEAADEVQVEYSGEPMRVGANSAFIMDTLASLPAGEVEFHFEGPSNPIVVKTPADESRVAVIMPMRVA